jgi:hypothetical protein
VEQAIPLMRALFYDWSGAAAALGIDDEFN